MRTMTVVMLFGLFVASCSNQDGVPKTVNKNEHFDPSGFDQRVPEILEEYNVAGVGIGIIRDGNLVWTGYYGEQGPDIPVTQQTIFNTASVAKTVSSETLIALANKGLVSLDEPIHPYVEYPDLSSDPRYKKLTARILLSHRGGLLNWPYEYEDGRATFIDEPGDSFSYSGMGIELAAQYAENKLETDFESLAQKHVLNPLGITEMSLGRIKPIHKDRLAVPMMANGEYADLSDFSDRLSANSTGEWSAADDLLTTVDDYAALLIGILDSGWLTEEYVAERTNILSSLKSDPIWNCKPSSDVLCAREYGHGLGWMVYKYDNKTVVKHGGNDAGENALVLYEPESGNGAVLFANGGNGIFATTQILGLTGDYPEITAYYRQLIAKFFDVDLPEIESIN